jgi:hypothetical protein
MMPRGWTGWALALLGLWLGPLALHAATSGDYEYAAINGEATITGYTGTAQALTVPTVLGGLPVTAIGSYAFDSSPTLTAVSIPDGVRYIASGAFGRCPNLASITVSPAHQDYASLGGVLFDKAFQTLLAVPGAIVGTYTIPDGVTEIGYNAFRDCDRLTSVSIPDSVTIIGGGAFSDCDGLTELHIPASVVSINNQITFDCDQLAQITVALANPNYASSGGVLFNKDFHVLREAPKALSGLYTVPETVTFILSFAFQNCTELLSVIVSEGVTGIGSYAFNRCTNLETVTLPTSITDIGDSAFAECGHLVQARIFADPTNYDYGTDVWQGVAADFRVYHPVAGSDFAYTIDRSDNTATITCYLGAGGLVAIPTDIEECPVRRIGHHAFSACPAITCVSFDHNSPVMFMDADAFSWSANLEAVHLPEALLYIGNRAFAHCSQLLGLSFPAQLVGCGDEAFADCERLSFARFQGDAPKLGPSVFAGVADAFAVSYRSDSQGFSTPTWEGYPATGWTGDFSYRVTDDTVTITGYFGNAGGAVAIPPTLAGLPVTSIGTAAFLGLPITTVSIPPSVGIIEPQAFAACTSLQSLSGGTGLTTIGERAFAYCSSLTSFNTLGTLTLPESLSTIGDRAFDYCLSLTALILPPDLTSLGEQAFRSCLRLHNIWFLGDAPAHMGAEVFEELTNGRALGYRHDALGFESPTWLGYPTQADFTYTVTDGGATITGYSGPGGEVSIPARIAGLPVVRIARFFPYESPSQLLVTGVTIPEGVTTIDERAFYETPNLARVTFPSTLQSIGANAFASCSALVDLTFPAALESIAVEAFANCVRLSRVHFLGNAPTSIGFGVFSGAAFDFTVYYSQGSVGFTSPAWMGYSAKAFPADFTYELADGGVAILGYTGPGGSLVIPATLAGLPVLAIADFAFYGCTTLTELTLPSGLLAIGDLAFANCSILGDIHLPTSLTTLGAWAFAFCDRLSSVSLPAALTAIGDNAFAFNSGLSQAWFRGDAPAMGRDVFRAAAADFVVYYQQSAAGFSSPLWLGYPSEALPDDFDYRIDGGAVTITGYTGRGGAVVVPALIAGLPVLAIDDAAFYGCASLTEMTLPAGLARIGDLAFANCSSLTQITFPASLVSLGDWAFAFCDRLVRVRFLGNAPAVGEAPFYRAATGFLVSFHETATGFATPTWLGYPTQAAAIDFPARFSEWLAAYGLSGATTEADPDADHRPNLLEYALATDPLSPDAEPILRPSVTHSQPSTLQLTFERIADPNLTYIVESSADLLTWEPTPVWTSTGAENLAGQVVVTDSAPLATTPRRFLRLRVSTP